MGTRPLVRNRIEIRISEQLASSVLLAFAALFMLVGIAMLHLAPYPLTLTPRHLLAVGGGWFGAWGGVHFLLRRKLPRYDPIIVSLVAMLTGWGFRPGPGRPGAPVPPGALAPDRLCCAGALPH